MDVNKLLDELEELVEHGQGSFLARMRYFRKAFFLDIDDVLDLTHQIRTALPQQIQRADGITRDKDRIINEAKEQAQRMVEEAAEQSEHTVRQAQEESRLLISNNEITRLSKLEGQRIIDQAQQEAESIRTGALEYTRSMLDRLSQSIDTLAQHISQIQQVARQARDEVQK